MFTVWMINGESDTIYITNTGHFEQTLRDRNIDIKRVKSQELRLETLVRLKDNEFRVFILCLT